MGMIISRNKSRAIYEHLLNEKILIIPDLIKKNSKFYYDISNKFIFKVASSLKGRKFIREIFLWQHFYWTLSYRGEVFLRNYFYISNINNNNNNLRGVNKDGYSFSKDKTGRRYDYIKGIKEKI